MPDCSVANEGSYPWRGMRSLRMAIGRVRDYCMEIMSGVDGWLESSESDLRQRGLETLEVFVEGTRSRDRRFLAPRTGVLRALQVGIAREGSPFE